VYSTVQIKTLTRGRTDHLATAQSYRFTRFDQDRTLYLKQPTLAEYRMLFASYLAFSCTVRNKPKILWTRIENWKPILYFLKTKNSVSGKGNRTRRVTQSLADATAVRLDVSRVFSYMYRLIERLYTRGVHKRAQWKVDSHIPSTNQTPALHSTSISGVFRRGLVGAETPPRLYRRKFNHFCHWLINRVNHCNFTESSHFESNIFFNFLGRGYGHLPKPIPSTLPTPATPLISMVVPHTPVIHFKSSWRVLVTTFHAQTPFVTGHFW